ncbi:MAG: ThuA domain-containing protein [bacterium]
MKNALIVWGGWDGHEPEKVAAIFGSILKNNGFQVEVSDSLNAFNDADKLKELHLIVPIWTMGEIEKHQVEAVSEAVANGTGLAGCHGGMCDAFRNSVLWQFITGGNWVSHPGSDGVEYTVEVCKDPESLIHGIPDFSVKTEHYYLHVDPSVKVLATTAFPKVKWYHSANGKVDMPVVWTKKWGWGRVFYCSLGHHADIFDLREPMEIMKRGLLWAARGKEEAVLKNLSGREFKSGLQMF